jgi:chitinase
MLTSLEIALTSALMGNMKLRHRCWLALLLLPWSGLRAQPKVVAYVPNWINLEQFARQIDYTKITHLNLAFENPTNAEGELSFNKGNELVLAEARKHQVKVLISLGGGSASGDKELLARYADLLSEPKRQGFAAKIAKYLQAHAVDGIDVDLEGPSIIPDYGPFIQCLRETCQTKGKLLTAALSQGYGGNHVPDATLQKFDFVNIMAYDGAGYWDPNAPGQHSSLEFAKANVAYWLRRGLAKEKAVLGVPFYGYGFGAAFKQRDYPYAAILQSYPGAEKSDQVGDTIWYNGIPTVRAKAEFALESGLGGMMIWSLDSDAPGEHSLLKVIHETLLPQKPASGK